MKRTPIYSRSARRQRTGPGIADAVAPVAPDAGKRSAAADAPAPGGKPASPGRFAGVRALVGRHERALLAVCAASITAACFLAYMAAAPPPRQLTQKDIDAAVMHTLQTAVLPSPEARAYEKIRPSVVRVSQQTADGSGDLRGVGTGVVIIDNGTILTNLHVIGNEHSRLKVRFADGTESSAVVLKRQPEHDLAVIRATTLPDDLVPATLRSAQDLAIGDKVVAVGFPFNIGPSASSGIISGLQRTYLSLEDNELLENLIQFDAAANPGNSGGPLVTMEGEVVGIVTAILSPHEQGTFIGIGFAVPIETAAGAAGDSPF